MILYFESSRAPLAFMKSVNFIDMSYGIWFTIAGIWMLIIGFASIPDAKRGRSKSGAYLEILIGAVLFVYATSFWLAGFSFVQSNPEIKLIGTIVFGMAIIMWSAHLLPEVIKRKSFVQALA